VFIDSHCHFDFTCFDGERCSLIAQLISLNINKIIIPATQKKAWSTIQKLASEHNALYYSLGIHPHFLADFQDQDLHLLEQILSKKEQKCVALGEIGLDKRIETALATQEYVFIKQLKLAKKLQLPVILHIVGQQGRVLAILKKEKFTQGGVYHAFSGSYEVAVEFIKLGFKLGVGGVITYPTATKTKDTISRLPIESLVLETDAPDMPIYQQVQNNNSPVNLLAIFEALVSCRSESKSCLVTQIYKNTESIFSLNND
jgi:TatD DNase family protein